MSSLNTSGRPTGFITIPIEIVPTSNSTNTNSHHSSFRTINHDNSYNDFSNSPSWKKSSINTYSKGRLRPRQTLTTAYDRLINNSQLNQPYKDPFFHEIYQEPQYHHFQHRTYEPNSLHMSRSSEDLLSLPNDSINSNIQSKNISHYSSIFNNNGFQHDSDFMQPNKYTNSLRRSYDVLNDIPNTNKKFSINQQYPSEQQSYYRPTYVTETTINPNVVYSTEHHIPIIQEIINSSHDRSRSPASQRDESPIRPSPSAFKQPQESDFKVTKDATSQMAGQTTVPSSLSNDQQVPSNDTPVSTNISSTPPIRDSNTIALEKLEQIKQNLINLNQQVDAFNGATRDDRIYKELDEEALKMMIRCDELIDVSIDIKEKRKEMIRNVQTVLAKLESKVPINSTIVNNCNQMEIAIVVYESSSTNNIEQQKSSEIQNEETSVERTT
ncbi:unnamed protein product [Rotaria sordida]|uniref:BAG domain-containing protein n=1 Tax=Rotaria sordida TaxID=392033 RepID=A0A813Y9V0_9BILA|nr:unnamed protein product [Rotaria sordida]CAF1128600.1 unnamed protein product [Rotaria sordida]